MARNVPALAIQQPGFFNTSALENTIGYAISFFGAIPMFYGNQNTTQSIANNTYTAFNIDTEVFDPDGGHSTTTNISRFVPQVPGTYLFIGTSGWTGNATGTRRTHLRINNVTIKGGGTGYDVNQNLTSGGVALGLAAMNGSTDYVEVYGLQTSGGALSTISASEFACSLAALWISA